MYIRATGNISPQPTFGHPPFLAELKEQAGNRLYCVEPDYKTIIDVKLIRRMSRIIKMGVAAAMECLQEAGVAVPDAIVSGTAYGCLEDTGTFLSRMVEQNEELLAPTAFIQSTHNTVGAQVALMIGCHGYNNVFVHRGVSFESALLDGMMLLKDGEANNVLIGGVDETTTASHAILTRLGLYKRALHSNLDLFKEKSKGTISGEGAAFFFCTAEPSGNDYAKLDALHTFYAPENVAEVSENIVSFLSAQAVIPSDIDIVITGRNGDEKNDGLYDGVMGQLFDKKKELYFKQLCGEYPTAVSFALLMAANILKTATVPASLGFTGLDKPAQKILIYNQSNSTRHSLMLVSAC